MVIQMFLGKLEVNVQWKPAVKREALQVALRDEQMNQELERLESFKDEFRTYTQFR